MREANILYLVVSKFCDVDLHPNTVPNEQMGMIFENLIRRFNELANETAGDHFTPREVIRLMVSILFIEDDRLLATPGTVRKLLDPACGTGGMLAEAQNYLREHHGAALNPIWPVSICSTTRLMHSTSNFRRIFPLGVELPGPAVQKSAREMRRGNRGKAPQNTLRFPTVLMC